MIVLDTNVLSELVKGGTRPIGAGLGGGAAAV